LHEVIVSPYRIIYRIKEDPPLDRGHPCVACSP
jgi:hypothetical protein